MSKLEELIQFSEQRILNQGKQVQLNRIKFLIHKLVTKEDSFPMRI